jgi:hypothetical protein
MTRILGSWALVLVMALGLSACGWDPGTPLANLAHERVLALVNRISSDRHDDINGFARAAVAEDFSDVILIDIREQPAATLDDVFGTLTFFVPDPRGDAIAPSQRSEPYCFDVDFNWYGYAGMFAPDSVIEFVTCPDDPQAIVPPIDMSIHVVVATNAQDVALSVLVAEGQNPDATEIENEIAALLLAPTGEFEQTAAPYVLIDGENIGVAMGGAYDCVLVSRVDGIVMDLHPPSVVLQPGELGCRPETALADPDQLRSPH